jgi:hypothetical protein
METMNLLIEYVGRIWPAGILTVILFLGVRPRRELRIVIYVALFVLLRDAMTPLGLWTFGSNDGVFWLRMSENNGFLVTFGLSAALLTLAVYHFDRPNRDLWMWFEGNRARGLALGIAGALLVVLPPAIAYRFQPIAVRGGAVATSQLVPLLVFAITGNFMEGGLFRGYILGTVRRRYPRVTAGVLSGVFFAFCHLFLALTVTDVGWPLLAFTLWEGAIAGVIGAFVGVIPATITHGGAIFLLSSGLL